ncbi:MAG: hypothetical protein ISR95_07725 [Candidatus Marinimicrobia bacterium]|nr:hypothetical protein [Candidatus Neomarinimicrobiota bacterium]
MINRPTYKELNRKINLAKEFVINNQFDIVDPVPFALDLIELDCDADQKTISAILDEITPNDYVGTRPPQKSYKNKIKGVDLFAFAWESTKLGCKVYFKFGIINDTLWLVSLHKDKIQ